MFFLLSKIVWAVVAPSNILFLVLICALASTRWRRPTAQRLVVLSTSLLIALVVLPVGSLLLRPLEDRFPQPDVSDEPTGAIVLGGSTNEVISAARGQPTIVGAATRVTSAVALARRFPHMRLVFSGGSGAVLLRPRTEADETFRLWTALGVAPDRITLEDKSRNTYENAVFTRQLVEPKPGEHWLLITSAFHMPRAMGLFRAVNFPVTPYPVDYQTAGTTADWLPSSDIGRSLSRVDLAAKEWIGLLVYRLTGKTPALFPGPA